MMVKIDTQVCWKPYDIQLILYEKIQLSEAGS